MSAGITVASLAMVSAAGAAVSADASSPPPAPAIAPGAANANGTNYVFYTAADGAVQLKSLASGGQYAAAGGDLVGSPAPAVTGVGHDGLASFVVFGRGTDNALWTTTCDAESPTESSCSGSWTSLGGTLTSAPAVAEVSGDSYNVYARGSDGAVWGRNHVSSGWGAWYRTGGALPAGTGPSAAYDDGTYVLAVGTNHETYIQEVGVTGFTAAGGATDSSPALVDTSSALAGFARGTNNALWYHQFLSSTPGWHSLGGALDTGIGASDFTSSPGTDQLDEYALGTNNQVWQHTDLTSGTWSQVTP